MGSAGRMRKDPAAGKLQAAVSQPVAVPTDREPSPTHPVAEFPTI